MYTGLLKLVFLVLVLTLQIVLAENDPNHNLQTRSLRSAIGHATNGLEQTSEVFQQVESETEIVKAQLKQLKKMARRLQRKADRVDNKVEDHRIGA